MNEPNLKLERRAQQLLRESVDNLDARTRSRLTQARHAAVAAAKSPIASTPRWAMPAIGATAAAAVAVMLTTNPLQRQRAPVAAISNEQVWEIMTAEDNLELYRDMEFYAWLGALDDEQASAQPAAGKSGA